MMRRESPFTVKTLFHKSVYPAWYTDLTGRDAPDSGTGAPSCPPPPRSVTSPHGDVHTTPISNAVDTKRVDHQENGVRHAND